MVSDGHETFDVEITARGTFAPTAAGVELLGDSLDDHEALIDPIITLDLAAGTIEVSLEVSAPDPAEARRIALQAVGDALTRLGLADTWRPAGAREAVLALA